MDSRSQIDVEKDLVGSRMGRIVWSSLMLGGERTIKRLEEVRVRVSEDFEFRWTERRRQV